MSKKTEELTRQLGEYRRELIALQAEQKKLDKSTKEGSEAFEKNRIKISELTKETKKAQTELQNLNKTPWEQFKSGASSAFGAVGKQFTALTKTFVTNPIGATITAIVVVFAKLKEAFQQSDNASTALAKGLAALQPIFDIINKVVNKAVDGLAGLINGITGFLSKISPAIKESVAFAESQDKLEETLRKNKTLIEQNNSRLAELSNTFKQSTLSLEERNVAAEEYLRILKETARIEGTDSLEQLRSKWIELTRETGRGNDALKEAYSALQQLAFGDYSKEAVDAITSAIEATDFSDSNKQILIDYLLQYQKTQTKLAADTKAANKIITEAEQESIRAAKEASEVIRKAKFDESEAQRELDEVNAEALRVLDESVQKTDNLRASYLELVMATGSVITNQKTLEGLFKSINEGYSKGAISADEYTKAMDALLAAQQSFEELESAEDTDKMEQYYLLKRKNEGATNEELLQAALKFHNAKMSLMDEETLEYQQALEKRKQMEEDLANEQSRSLQNALNISVQIAAASAEIISEITNAAFEAQNEKINENLEKTLAANEEKQESLKKQLDAGLITEEQYQTKSTALDKEAEKAKAEAKYQVDLNNWKQSMLEIGIQTAIGIATAVAQNPMFGGLPGSAIAAANGITQLAIVGSKKPQPPKFATGGLIIGPSHKDGGVLLEAEGGEAIINKKSTRKYRALLSAINEAEGGVSIGKFATGGLVNDGGYGRTRIRTASLKDVKIIATIEDIRRAEEQYINIETNRYV